VEGNDVYISLFINNGEEYGEKFILVTQEIIEINPLETGLVTAQKITDNLELQGHIAIYGVYFDTGKFEIKPESGQTLTEIAAFLKANPGNKYFIVGHTDNTGDYNANMTLSENRAKAVRDYLVNEAGIDAGQLEARGASSICPVTANTTDAGKARNRRVEIVER
jgi:OOP family OmpA-OmpF porin